MSRINEGDLSLRSQIIAQGEINGYRLLSACIQHFSHILLNLSFLIESLLLATKVKQQIYLTT